MYSKEGKFVKNGDFSSVILAKEPQSLLRGFEFNLLEPQSLREYYNNISSIQITSNYSNVSDNPLKLQIQDSALFNSRTYKLCPTGAAISWCVPNVNQRNNTITFFSSFSGLNHTVVVPEGFYLTPLLLMNAVVISLNTATGASGLTFSFVLNALLPSSGTLSSAGGSYFFILTSSAIVKGKFCFGLPLDQIATLSKIVGSINLIYTRWVDIISSTLTKHSKNSNTSNRFGNNRLLFRMYIPKATSGTSDVVTSENHLHWINWNFTETITNIDFELHDEFGDLLYVPQAFLLNNTFNWGIEIITATY